MTIGFRGLWGRTFAVGTISVLLAAGCSEIPGLDTVTNLISPSKNPSVESESGQPAFVKFRLGDRYTFDNPVERWQITQIKGDRVYWRNDTGERQVTGFNPLLPEREWRNREQGSGRRLIRDIEGDLFPMRVGAKMSFRATATSDKPPFGWENKWTCQVDDKKSVDVLSGAFEVFVVRCGYSESNQITYYYAPKVGHYVVRRTKQEAGKPDQVRNLLSFERADGTVVAGIVADRAKELKKEKPTTINRQGTQAALPVKSAVKGKRSSYPAVNPTLDGASNKGAADALASVVLTTPKFGGRSQPLPPVRPTPAPDQPKPITRTDMPPPPKPAPVVPVQRSTPSSVPQVVKRTAPRVPSSNLGPRAATSARPFQPKTRIPVPPPTPKAAIPPVPKPVPVRPSVPPPLKVRKAVPAVPAVAPRVPSVPPPPSPRIARTVVVHLASFRSEEAAQKGWVDLAAGNSDLLGELKPEIRRADVKEKGAFYRLYAGPVPSNGAAELCRQLKDRGVFCTPAS